MDSTGHLAEMPPPAAPRAEAAPFRPRFPWLGGDLQTLRNMIVRPRPRFDDAPPERLAFAIDDGTDDALLGELHRPARTGENPLALLVHGLTGCADSFYVLATARHLLDRGFSVLRLNLRGAGPSAGTCREQYHAGRTADLRRVLATLDASLTRNPVVAVGFSLGGNLLLKLLAEEGTGSPIRRAAAISPPVDLAAAARCIQRPRNFLYMRYLLACMKEEVRASRGGLSEAVAEAVRTSRSIVEYDDRVVAPRYGFASAADYYARSSSHAVVDRVRVPALVIHAHDDPWIPTEAFADRRWQAHPRVRLLLTDRGGHVGFHGRGAAAPWHDRVVGDFIAGGRA